ncbi:hypothetical protein [Prochlorothrix hollandica]|uniref:hypothetical protein n=1 Tax=Prochlorothrix hollandica TaxID=1223 RepID=UPI00034B8947
MPFHRDNLGQCRGHTPAYQVSARGDRRSWPGLSPGYAIDPEILLNHPPEQPRNPQSSHSPQAG